MKVILSRKGFDSSYGGIPSPILNDKWVISLPIPSENKGNPKRYSELKLNDNLTYKDLILKLQGKSKQQRCIIYKGEPCTIEKMGCHLDPDIYDKVVARRPEWRGLFGQSGSAQGHLKNIGVGDIFLFFGWFRRAKCDNGEIHYVQDAPDLHVIFGYFEVGGIWGKDMIESNKFPDWAKDHPHFCDKTEKDAPNNTIYVAKEHLSWDNRKQGWGVFHFDEDLVLTENTLTRSKWKLMDVLKDEKVTLSYHNMEKCRITEQTPHYFQSVRRGQEFIFSESKIVDAWARGLIDTHTTQY